MNHDSIINILFTHVKSNLYLRLLTGNLNKILIPADRKAHIKNLTFSENIFVGFDSKAAYICGQLRSELEKNGTPLGLADLEIAAICLAGNFTLITGNTKHFARISALRYANWL